MHIQLMLTLLVQSLHYGVHPELTLSTGLPISDSQTCNAYSEPCIRKMWRIQQCKIYSSNTCHVILNFERNGSNRLYVRTCQIKDLLHMTLPVC